MKKKTKNSWLVTMNNLSSRNNNSAEVLWTTKAENTEDTIEIEIMRNLPAGYVQSG